MWRIIFIGFWLYNEFFQSAFDKAARKGVDLAKLYTVGKEDFDAEIKNAIRERISQLGFAAAFRGLETTSPSQRKVLRDLIIGQQVSPSTLRRIQVVLGEDFSSNWLFGVVALIVYLMLFAGLVYFTIGALYSLQTIESGKGAILIILFLISLFGLMLTLYSLGSIARNKELSKLAALEHKQLKAN